MTAPRRRTGLVPDTELQIALMALSAGIASRVARSHAGRGVPPALAADHGVLAASAIIAYVVFVAPMLMLSTLGVFSSILGPFVFGPEVVMGWVLGVRLIRWVQEPADRRMIYRIPTWLIVVVGGLWTCGLVLLMLVGIALGSGD